MKDSNLRFPRSKQGGIAASPMRDKNLVSIPGFEPGPYRPKRQVQPDNTLRR